jgi:putative membrane protein insertion efficiency factor
MIKFLELLHWLYKHSFSLAFGSRCRFFPSCSDFCLECVKKDGLIKGMYPALKRVLSCHPFSPGGYDPVSPEVTKASKN